MYDILLEEKNNKSTQEDKIENCCGNIYAHLMKINSYKSNTAKISDSWISTIFHQNELLREVKNRSYWAEVNSSKPRLDRIERNAKRIYIKDSNTDAKAMYNAVRSEIPNLETLKNPDKIAEYIINTVNKDKDITNSVKHYYKERVGKDYKE